jgi:sentrin-specific protease 1
LDRAAAQVDIFQLDYYIVPVHRPAHWCLAVLDMKNKRIDYFDSLGTAPHIGQ